MVNAEQLTEMNAEHEILYNFLQEISQFSRVCHRLDESADSEGNWNYINLHIHEKDHNTFLIVSIFFNFPESLQG